MKAYSVRISDALFAELKQEAHKRGLSVSAVARERIMTSFAASPAPKRGYAGTCTHQIKANLTALNAPSAHHRHAIDLHIERPRP
jgi:hypothetical protein